MGPKDWVLGHIRTDLVTFPSGLPCLVPEQVPHATVSVTGVVLFGGQPVTVTCDTGYGVNGTTVTTQTLRCNTDQTLDAPHPCLGRVILIYAKIYLICTFIIKIITLICLIVRIVVYIYIYFMYVYVYIYIYIYIYTYTYI